MIKITYKAVNYSLNGWGVSTYVNKQYSHTRFELTELLAKNMVARLNHFNA